MIKDKTILITGGTGSFGHEAVSHFLKEGAKRIIIYSRDEYKQVLMKNEFKDPRCYFVIGDVRDLERLTECTRGVDIIIHAAAMKHVDICEQNRNEAHKTNVLGSGNVTEAAIANNVNVVINLSADKAVYPAGAYGETKAEAERIFTEANRIAREQGKNSKFASLRYSNVLGSRGSVVELFEKILQNNEIVTVFDEKMIRLVLTQNQVLDLTEYAAEKMIGGEIFLVESPMLKVADLARAMQKKIGKGKVEIKTEIREGEKYDAVLVSKEESARTLVSKEGYLIIAPEKSGLNFANYLNIYGENRFTKGEYGTKNAPLLNEEEITKMVYENKDQQNTLSENNIPAIAGGKSIRATFLPYATQWIGEEEKKEVMSVLDSEWLTTGPKVKKFEEEVAKFVGAKYTIAVNSGTAALHCCTGAIDIEPGDEVITTPFTFLATANSIVYRGGIPVLVDVEEDTYNIDPKKIEQKITSKTKAIMPVHYGGHPCEMSEIYALAKKYNLKVIEDAAHAFSAEYCGKKIGGSGGDLAIFSFHPVKNITTAEGGIITTNDENLAKWCVMHRTHGITKEAMERYGKNADWGYDMQRLGHRYNMTEFQAALGIAQLGKIEKFQKRREEIVARYNEEFSSVSEIILPACRPNVKHSWHLYPIRIKPECFKADRNQLIKALKAENLGVNVHYIPIHLHSYYQKHYGMKKGDFPVTEKIYDSIITLPLFPKMSEQDVQDVIAGVKKVVEYYKK